MIAKSVAHASLADHVHLDAQEIPQVHDQRAVIKERALGVKAND